MSQNAYVVKFTRDLSVADNLIRMAQALNDKNPFFHVPDPIYEQFMQEKYILNGTKESAVSLSGDIKEINEIALKERNKQAKAILLNLAKTAGNEEKMKEELFQYNKLTGDDFIKLAQEYGPKEYRERDYLGLFETYDIEPDVRKDEYEFHKKVIEFNNGYEREYEDSDLIARAYTGAIKSLGYEKSDLIDMINKVKESKNPTKTMIDEFKYLMTKQSNKIDEFNRNENAIYDEHNKFFKVCDMYLKDKMPENYIDTLKEYMKTDEFKDFAVNLTSPFAVSYTTKHSVRLDLDDHIRTAERGKDEFESMIQDIKRLEYIHSKRPFFTRFVDWFKSEGENSTINMLKKELMSKGYTKSDIKTALQNADPHKKPKGEISETIDSLTEEVTNSKDGKLGEFDYVLDDANRKLDHYRTDTLAMMYSQARQNEKNQESTRTQLDLTDEIEDSREIDDVASSNEMEEELDIEENIERSDFELDDF